MNPFPDLASLLEALQANYGQPAGSTKVAAAEELLAHAEDLARPEGLVAALLHLIEAYEYSSERDRLLVPFARLLRLWDTSPEAFDSHDAHGLHWFFKWASSGMLRTPSVSLAAIEAWRDEMGRRYAIAGHSPRAVWQSEHVIAAHLGDDERARTALAQWWAAPRDEMADCAACEIGERGSWFAQLGDDTAAVEAWDAVLSGAETCREEPHRVLAKALLPLVRLGRLDQACSAHLRGYPLTQGSESLGAAVARHIEFCALTGNEGRGLELLAEQPGYLTSDGSIRERMEFLAITALLMDRLVALDRADLVVPAPPGRQWTAVELGSWARAGALADAAAFDARNGNDAVGTRLLRRMDAAPLLDRLPLGTRSVLPAPSVVADARGETRADARAETGADEQPEADARWQAPAVEAAEERFERAAEAGDHEAVRDALREALTLADGAAPSRWRAWALVQLGEASAALGDLDAAIGYAREATYWEDLERRSPFPRYRLGAHLMAAGRGQEAAPILEQVLADLGTSDEAPEGVIVQTHWWLGDVYADGDDQLAAAEHWAAAARIAQTWDDQDDHAVLSYLIGRALARAGRRDEAASAYERAARLFGDLGQPVRRGIVLRARAWLGAEDDPRSASVAMRFAIAALEAARDDPARAGEAPSDAEILYELAESWRQYALILADYDDGEWTAAFDGALPEAYASAVRAAEAFTGPDEWRDERLGCVLLAGELAHAAGDDAAARVHLTEVLDDRSETDRAAQLREVAASVLERLQA